MKTIQKTDNSLKWTILRTDILNSKNYNNNSENTQIQNV